MASSAQTYHLDMAKFGAKLQGRLDGLARQTAQELAKRIVARTPVDTGFARASWWGTVTDQMTHPAQPAPGEHPKDGGPALSQATLTFAGGTLGQTFALYNNANYIVFLEYGHSKQAPNGFVGITMAEAPAVIEHIARILSR